MHTRWLRDFVDPASQGTLELETTASDGEHVIEGRLRVRDTDISYPIIRGVPRFLATASARTGPPGESTDETVSCYGRFWKQAESGTRHHSPAEIAAYEVLLSAMLGLDGPSTLESVFHDDFNSLNAGCGVAWSEYLFNTNPRSNRFAVDLSSSVDIAFERTRALSNVCIAQADLTELPFRLCYFDVIFCGGVLHHTPNPLETFSRLCGHLKPGGLIGIFVYKTKPFLRELADRELKKITTTMTDAECELFAAQMARLGRSLQQISETLAVEDDIPVLGIKAGQYQVQKFVFDHFLKCYHNAALGFEHSVLANIDWYRPKRASHHTQAEVSSWFETNAIGDVRFTDLPGWEHSSFFVSGRKL